jgi:hypothetical protein
MDLGSTQPLTEMSTESLSRKNAWKQIYIFPLRYNTTCVPTSLTVLITLKVSTSFIVTLYFLKFQWLLTGMFILHYHGL